VRTRTATATWPALGSTAVVRVAEPWQIGEAARIVREQLVAFDRACSRFREDSELACVNRAGPRPASAGPLLIEALAAALRGAEVTDGALDPTVGVAMERAGYDRDWRLIAKDVAEHEQAPLRLTARRLGSWRQIGLDRVAGTIAVPAGVKLDLGATAKALAADRACAAAHGQLGGGVLVSLGGDIATAGHAPEGGWQIHVTDDHRDGLDAPGQRVTISSGALATSSTLARSWSRAGRRMHHIIDPATGEPAETPWRTVSVAAGDCLDANIASTAALLRGEDAPSWLEGLGLPARLVGRDGVVATVAGWPEADARMPAVTGVGAA
jgi:thiamine biosynthesis lipoprotein ApbE